MRRRIRTMDSLARTVLELVLGITACAFLLEGIGLIFVKQKLSYTIGIFYGAALAIAMTFHMAHNLSDALSWDEENARRIARKGSFFRYLMAALFMGGFAYFKLGNFLGCVLGIMCLKAAAYLQPTVHKIINHIFKIREEGGCENAIIDDEDTDDISDWIEHRFYDSWFD